MQRLSRTGRIREQISPKTGKLAVYIQTLQNYVYDHQTPPDLYVLASNITADLQAKGYDAYCESISLVQGALTDTMQPSVWIASESVMVAGKVVHLLDPITVIAIASVTKALIKLFIIITIYFIVTAVKAIIYPEPKKYFLPEETGITEPVSWEEYISYQNGKYWYVCPKDGFGIGERSKYPNIEDVPASEVQVFTDHCAIAPDISEKGIDWTQVVTGVVIVGLVFLGTTLVLRQVLR